MRPSRNALLVQALGVVLKERRQELGMTQEDLAGEAELDRAFITMMEAGKKQPSVSVFWKLATGVRLSAAELATRVDSRHGDMRAACTLESARTTREDPTKELS